MPSGKITDSKTFCPHAWLSATHANGGYFKPCCVYNQKDHSNKWGIGFKHNSEKLNHIRAQMIQGNKPKECESCWKYEDRGLASVRTEAMAKHWWKPWQQKIDDCTDTNGRFDQLPVYFDLKLGNKCNLACRMCSSDSSSLIQKEVSDHRDLFSYHPSALEELDYTVKHNVDETGIDKVFDAIQSVDDVVEIKFTGGEPFLNHRISDLIDHFIDQGISQKTKLNFTSNLTTIPNKLLPKLKHFNYAIINVSMEGIESAYEYIRYPAKWNKFQKNFDELTNSGIETSVVYTVNALTVFNMPEWLEWIKKYDVNWHANPVLYPLFYHTRVLPENLKSLVIERLAKSKHLCPDHVNDIDGIIQMIQEPQDAETWQFLIKDTMVKDQLRKQSIHRSLPELASFMPVDRS